ncbi:MAG: CoA-binding protein [Clostridiaceae bacterium]
MDAYDFLKYKNWVVVGNVLTEGKYANKILNRLKENSFNVKGLHPKDDTGKLAKSLKDVEFSVDVIDLCINPARGLEILKEAKELGIKNVLIQPGAESQDILDYAKENNINAIEGCALVILSQLK